MKLVHEMCPLPKVIQTSFQEWLATHTHMARDRIDKRKSLFSSSTFREMRKKNGVFEWAFCEEMPLHLLHHRLRLQDQGLKSIPETPWTQSQKLDHFEANEHAHAQGFPIRREVYRTFGFLGTPNTLSKTWVCTATETSCEELEAFTLNSVFWQRVRASWNSLARFK